MLNKKTFIFLLVFLILPAFSYTQSLIETYGEGEAPVITSKASAEMEALARAKWDAIEKATGIFIRAESIVQNFSLVDDVINKTAQGVIKDIEIVSKQSKGDTVKIVIKAKVLPKEMEKVLPLLSRNAALYVFIVSSKGEMNPVSTKLIETLTNQNFTVIDIAGAKLDPLRVEGAIRQKRFFELRSIMNRGLAGAMVIGKGRSVVVTKRGETIGYGLSSPFYVVEERVEYYIVVKDELGNTRILSAGTVSEKGRGMYVDAACEEAMGLAGEKVSISVLNKLINYLKTKETNVAIHIAGLRSIAENFEIKSKLQNLAWVSSVEEKGLGEFLVTYQENTIYLANSLVQMGNIYIKDFSNLSITAEYRK
ncbi:MAG: hypothetical protein J7L32_05950 [Thermoplasmata archaeon]|nr:hypothetical protein [Thermoplasmata archaeon]